MAGKKVDTVGGNLFQIAAKQLGDATQANRIATANNQLDPFISGAETLSIPATDLAATGGVPFGPVSQNSVPFAATPSSASPASPPPPPGPPPPPAQVDNPPVTDGPWLPNTLAVWQPPDPLPTLPGRLPPVLTAVRVDNPPPSIRARGIGIMRGIAASWEPPDPLPTLAEKLAPALSSVRVDKPTPNDGPWLPNTLAAWQPPDPLPTLTVKLSPQITVARVDQPAPNGIADWLSGVLSTWQPTPYQPPSPANGASLNVTIESADKTEVTTFGPTIIDSLFNVWDLVSTGAGTLVRMNGRAVTSISAAPPFGARYQPFAVSSGLWDRGTNWVMATTRQGPAPSDQSDSVVEIAYFSHVVYYADTLGKWFGWIGNVWVSQPNPKITTPSAPTGLTSTAVSSSAVNLSWTAPTIGGTGLSYITQYELTSSPGNWLNGPVVSTTTAQITGLGASTSYDFRVAATNTSATGPFSSTYTVSTSAPSSIITWQPTGKSASITLTGGNLTAAATGSTTPFSAPQSIVSATALSSGKAWFQVTFGNISANASVGLVNTSFPMGKSSGLGSDANGLAFFPFTGTGSAPPQTAFYNAATILPRPPTQTLNSTTGTITDSNFAVWALVSSSTNGLQISRNSVVTTSGLVTLLLYWNLRIYQQNQFNNWWYWSNAVSDWIAAPAGDPRIMSASVAGETATFLVDADLRLFWVQTPAMLTKFGTNAWNDNPGADPANGTGGIPVGVVGSLLICFFTSEGGATAALNAGSSPIVGSVNVPSNFPSWSGQIVTIVPPGAITLSLGNVGATTAPLSWTIASGSPTITYTIQRAPHGSTTFANVGTTTTNSFIDTGLTPNGTSYDYLVFGANGAGNGPNSNVVIATTSSQTLAPTQVGTLTFGAVTVSSIVVNLPLLLTGSPPTGYQLQYHAAGPAAFVNGPAYNESTDATDATAAGQSVTDASNNVFLLTPSTSSGLQITFNGTLTTSANVTDLLYWNHAAYYRDTTAAWRRWSGTAWTAISADPRLISGNLISPSGTALTSSSGSIRDASNRVWTLTGASGQIVIDGVTDSPTSLVVLLLFWNQRIHQLNANGNWYVNNGTAGNYTQTDVDPRFVPLTVSGLTTGTSYNFQAFAFNSAGNGPTSTVATAATVSEIISVNAIGTVLQNTAFTVSGTLANSPSAVSLSYGDDGGNLVAIPGTFSNTFSFTHPGLVAGAHTVRVTDGTATGSAGVTAATTLSTAPAMARAVGYNTRTLGPGVRVGQATGNNWYPYDSSVSIATNSDGSVTLAGPWDFNRQITSGDGATFGTAFGGGFYAEIDFVCKNATDPGNGPPGWPAFWANAAESRTTGVPQTPWPGSGGQNGGYSAVELDIFELFSDGWSQSLWDWGKDSSWIATAKPHVGGIDFTQRHKLGGLWIPATSTTQGRMEFYLDGVLYPNLTLLWDKFNPNTTPPLILDHTQGAVIDVQHLMMFAGSSATNPMTVYGIEIWQKDGSQNLPPTATSPPPPPPPPPPPAPATESPDRTFSTPGGTPLNASPNPGVAGSGNILAVTSAGQISLNGAVLGGAAVDELYYTQHTAYQRGAGSWYGPITATSTGNSVSDPTSATPPPPPPPPAGTTFSDDFNSFDSSKWYHNGFYEQGDALWVRPESLPISGIYTYTGGKLLLGLLPTPSQYQSQVGHPYVSGIMDTYNGGNNFTQQYGYFEVTVAVDKLIGQVYECVMLTPPANNYVFKAIAVRINTLASGVQLLEMFVYDQTNSAYTNQSLDLTAYHAYGVEWTSSNITFYIDRVQVFTCPNTLEFLPFYVKMHCNANFGPNATPIVNPSALPVYARVDSYNVWAQKPSFTTSPPPPPPPPPSSGQPTAPAQAVAAGYKTVAFFSGFDSASEITTDQSGNTLAKWYVSVTGLKYTVANSILTINNTIDTNANADFKSVVDSRGGAAFSTPGAIVPGNGFGQHFRFGYSEAKLKFDISKVSGGILAWWSTGYQSNILQDKSQESAEMDFLEVFNPGTGQSSAGLWNWEANPQTTYPRFATPGMDVQGGAGNTGTHAQANAAADNFSDWVIIGCLYTPTRVAIFWNSAAGRAAGRADYAVMDIDTTIDYSVNQDSTPIQAKFEASRLPGLSQFLALSGVNGTPLQVEYAVVWQ